MSEFKRYLQFTNTLPTRLLLSFLTNQKCGKSGKNIFIESLKKLRGETPDLCLLHRQESKLVNKGVKQLIKKYGYDKDQIRKALRNPNWGLAVIKGITLTLSGMGKFGLKKPFTPGGPFLSVYNFTKRCNLRCRHCYEDAGKGMGDELNLRQKLEVIDQLDELHTPAVAFSGGEPLLSKDFFIVAKHANECGMHVSVASNGTLINKEMARKLKEASIRYIQISLDGKKETHNYNRGYDSFDRTLQGIRNCIAEDLNVAIATTLTIDNCNEINDMVNLAKECGASFTLYNLVPTGRASIDLDIPPEVREEILEKLAKRAIEEARVAEKTKKKAMSIFTTAPQFARNLLEASGKEEDVYISPCHLGFLLKGGKDSNIYELLDFIGGCGAGHKKIDIDYNGNIIPCVFMPDVVLGNIKKTTVKEVWENSEFLKVLRRREKFKGYCRDCDYSKVCGGCRARSHAYYRRVEGDLSKSLTHSDLGCIFNREEYDIMA